MDQNQSSLLDMDLDDLADLPEFKVFPAGAHRCVISWESKEVNNHPCQELKMKAQETVELSDVSDTPLSAGDEGTILFMLDNEFGLGKFKAAMKPLATHFGVSKISEVIEASQGAEVLVVTKLRKNKDNPDQKYIDLVSLEVV